MYYCFEELFLSYDELVRLCVKSKSKDIIQYVHKCINNAEDYYMTESVINYMDKHKECISNREHLLEYLLIEAGQSISGYFKILKRGKSLYNKGECWIQNCADIQKESMTPHQVENVCMKKCNYCCKNGITQEKLIDLNDRSLYRKILYKLNEF